MNAYFAFSLSSHKFGYANLFITEQDGLRPVLILQNNTGNRFSPTVIVAAVTSRCSSKKLLPTHINIPEMFLPNNSLVLLEQLRTIDKSRLKEFIGKLNILTMQKNRSGISY